MSSSADSIKARFVAEQANIARYVEMTLRFAQIDDRTVREMNQTFKHAGVSGRLPRRRTPAAIKPFTRGDLHDLVVGIGRVETEVDRRLAELNTQFPPTQRHHYQHLERGYEGYYEECGEFFAMSYDLDDPCTEEDIERAVGHYIRRSQENNPLSDFVDDESAVDYRPATAALAFRQAIVDRAVDKIEALDAIKAEFSDLRFLDRIQAPDAEVNILRQGFILMMTAFDAAVFDLIRVALSNKLGPVVTALRFKKAYPADAITAFATFDEMRNSVIDDVLASKQLKPFLFDLKEIIGSLVDEAAGLSFRRLIEIINRRNLHIHKRGIVDEGYRNNFNIDSLVAGEVAAIDATYLDVANAHCLSCVTAIAQWADAP